MAGSKSSTGAGTVAATGGVERVEIVTRGEVRRSYTPEEKARLLTEAAVPGARVLLVAQRHGVSPSLVYRWRRQAITGLPEDRYLNRVLVNEVRDATVDERGVLRSRVSSPRQIILDDQGANSPLDRCLQ